MRNAFIKKITELASKDQRVVLLTGDLGFKIFDDFKEKFPNRFYNVGVAEANMITMAAGMALEGLKPFVYSIAPFATLRCAEQIRNDLCYNYKNVVVVGAGGGYTYGHNGPTHHAIEDIALLRAMPNITIACPGDPIETELVVQELYKLNGPSYLRIGRAGEDKVHDCVTGDSIEVGNAITIISYDDIEKNTKANIALISTGNMLPTASNVVNYFSNNLGFYSFPFIKPIDYILLDSIFRDFEYVFILEEHSIYGGFYSAVAELFSKSKYRNRCEIVSIGIKDHFANCSGDREYLRELAQISFKDIVKEIEFCKK